jgi:hypothetical protein
MRPARLIRLYPPAWRARYGDEFLALAGDRPATLRQTIDIVAGAIDAWLTADVRRATLAGAASAGGGHMPKSLTCATQPTITTRDGLIGAAVMIAATLVLTMLGVWAKTSGWTALGETTLSLSFPAAMAVSLPFWMMPGVPRRAKVLFVGVILAILAGIGATTAILG